jgi:hypothetical protein
VRSRSNANAILSNVHKFQKKNNNKLKEFLYKEFKGEKGLSCHATWSFLRRKMLLRLDEKIVEIFRERLLKKVLESNFSINF